MNALIGKFARISLIIQASLVPFGLETAWRTASFRHNILKYNMNVFVMANYVGSKEKFSALFK